MTRPETRGNCDIIKHLEAGKKTPLEILPPPFEAVEIALKLRTSKTGENDLELMPWQNVE